jgi:hypothetical protein
MRPSEGGTRGKRGKFLGMRLSKGGTGGKRRGEAAQRRDEGKEERGGEEGL